MLECKETVINDGILEGASLHLDHKNKGGHLLPRFIVMHYTAGPSLKGAVRTLTDPRRKASAHFIIDKDGSIAQLVETERIAWHAGKSAYSIYDDDGQNKVFKSLNQHSIGIEMVNAGKLLRSRSRNNEVEHFPIYKTWWGAEVEIDDVFIDDDYFIPGKWANSKVHRIGVPFESYSPEQIESALSLTYAISRLYPSFDVLGHSDIAVPEGRKIDPGPAFPIDKFRALIHGRQDGDV